MKSTKFYCLVLMTKYIFKTVDMKNIFKKTFLSSFNFQSNQDSFFVKHINFEKRKGLNKKYK